MTEQLKQARELKPCPFCGSKKYDPVVDQNTNGTWFIGCQAHQEGGCGFSSSCDFTTREAAITAWNTRAIEQSPITVETTPAQETALEALQDLWAHTGLPNKHKLDLYNKIKAALQPTAPVRDDATEALERILDKVSLDDLVSCQKDYSVVLASLAAQQPAVDLKSVQGQADLFAARSQSYLPYEDCKLLLYAFIDHLAANGMIKGQDLAWEEPPELPDRSNPEAVAKFTNDAAWWLERNRKHLAVARKMRGE